MPSAKSLFVCGSGGELGLGGAGMQSTLVQVGIGQWKSIAAGNGFVFAVMDDGTLWSWGVNDYGQLGLGDYSTRLNPTQVGSASNWLSVSAGNTYAFAVNTAGLVYAVGSDAYGETGGFGGTTLHLVTTLSSIAKVSCGDSHTVALTTTGQMWATGYNANGELGNGTGVDRATFGVIGVGVWLDVDVGYSHTLAIKSDGTLWASGVNANGELGVGDTTGRLSFTQIGSSTWSSVSAGYYYSLGVSSAGALLSWGRRAGGVLGDGLTSEYVTSPNVVSASGWVAAIANLATHSAGIRSDNTLWTWGDSTGGKLGHAPSTVPVQVGVDRWSDATVGTSTTIAIAASEPSLFWTNFFGQRESLGT